jgi:uncharacterized protein
VFVYARGRAHPLKDPCVGLLESLAAGLADVAISVEAAQELASILRRRGLDGERVAADVRDVTASCDLLDFTAVELAVALELIAQHPQVGGRDAVHAATALSHGIAHVVSPDRAFDAVPGLMRWDPEDALGRLRRR